MKRIVSMILPFLALACLGMAAVPAAMKMPDFELQGLDGGSVRSADFKGKVVLVNFWATWCPPCLAEIPVLKKMQEEYSGKGFEVLGISVDEDGTQSVKPFVEKKKINYKVVMGNDAVVQAFGGLRGIPTTFLVDREGNIVRKYLGEQSEEDFKADIQKVL